MILILIGVLEIRSNLCHPASPSVGRPLLPPSSWRSVQHSGHAPQPCHIQAPDTWEPRKVSVGLQVCFKPWVLHKTHDVTIALWATLLKSFKHDETSGTWNFEISLPAVSPGHRLPPRHQAMCPRASTSLAAARRTNLARAVFPWMFRKERLHLSYSVMIQGLWHGVAEIWPTGMKLLKEIKGQDRRPGRPGLWVPVRSGTKARIPVSLPRRVHPREVCKLALDKS